MPLCLERGFWSVTERFAEYSQRSWSRSGHRTVGPGRWAVGGMGSLDSQRRSSHITFGIYHPDLISGHAGSSSFFPAVSLWHGMNGKMRKKMCMVKKRKSGEVCVCQFVFSQDIMYVQGILWHLQRRFWELRKEEWFLWSCHCTYEGLLLQLVGHTLLHGTYTT